MKRFSRRPRHYDCLVMSSEQKYLRIYITTWSVSDLVTLHRFPELFVPLLFNYWLPRLISLCRFDYYYFKVCKYMPKCFVFLRLRSSSLRWSKILHICIVVSFIGPLTLKTISAWHNFARNFSPRDVVSWSTKHVCDYIRSGPSETRYEKKKSC